MTALPVVGQLLVRRRAGRVRSRCGERSTVELALVDGVLEEVGGSRQFDASLGHGLDGDEALDHLPGFTSFPRDYATFWPNGVFWTIQGLVPAAS